MYKEVNDWNALKLNEYQGTFEIVSGNVSDGKFYMQWTIASEYDAEQGGSVPVKRDNGKWRNVPIKVVLGDQAQAIANLEWLIRQIRASATAPGPPEEKTDPIQLPPDDDVPF